MSIKSLFFNILKMLSEMNQNNKKEPNNQFRGLGISIGLCIGVVYGIIFDNLSLGISLGLCFGVVFGTFINKK